METALSSTLVGKREQNWRCPELLDQSMVSDINKTLDNEDKTTLDLWFVRQMLLL